MTLLPAPTETPSLTTYSSTHPCSMAMSSDQERMKLTSRVRGPRGAAVVVRDALMSRQSSGSYGEDNLSPPVPLVQSGVPTSHRKLLASLEKLSVFEERCARTLHRYISEMDAKTRRKALEDWGASDGKFSSAKLFLRIEVMMVSEDECETGGVGGLMLRRGSSCFIPVQPQPLRRLKLCVGGAVGNLSSCSASVTAGSRWIR